VHWGTSTWTYPEWDGIVYHKPYTTKSIKTASLAEYAEHKPFHTVGVDNTFYAPPNPFTLEEYAKYLPKNFPCVLKMWETLTVPVWPNQKKYGRKAGQVNSDFLNPEVFESQVADVYEKAFKTHVGALVFEFGVMYPPHVPSLDFFLEKLDNFFSKVSRRFRYGVEIRNKGYLQEAYFNLLRKHGVSHVYNHWTHMPRPSLQMQAAGENPFTADFAVSRWLTPLGVKYQKAVELNSPYNSLKARLPEMREDLELLIERALEFNIPLYLLINNRTEGCAPLTISEVDQHVRQKFAG
jgi:uncharacterized protein YecE (DUF72 family)